MELGQFLGRSQSSCVQRGVLTEALGAEVGAGAGVGVVLGLGPGQPCGLGACYKESSSHRPILSLWANSGPTGSLDRAWWRDLAG